MTRVEEICRLTGTKAPNVDENGIHYGVVCSNALVPEATDEIYCNGRDLGWEAAREEIVEAARKFLQAAGPWVYEVSEDPPEVVAHMLKVRRNRGLSLIEAVEDVLKRLVRLSRSRSLEEMITHLQYSTDEADPQVLEEAYKVLLEEEEWFDPAGLARQICFGSPAWRPEQALEATKEYLEAHASRTSSRTRRPGHPGEFRHGKHGTLVPRTGRRSSRA